MAESPALVEIAHRRPRRPIHPLQPPLDPGPEVDQGHQLRPPARLEGKKTDCVLGWINSSCLSD